MVSYDVVSYDAVSYDVAHGMVCEVAYDVAYDVVSYDVVSSDVAYGMVCEVAYDMACNVAYDVVSYNVVSVTWRAVAGGPHRVQVHDAVGVGAPRGAGAGAAGRAAPSHQGLTLVHISAQLEPCLTRNHTLNTLNPP